MGSPSPEHALHAASPLGAWTDAPTSAKRCGRPISALNVGSVSQSIQPISYCSAANRSVSERSSSQPRRIWPEIQAWVSWPMARSPDDWLRNSMKTGFVTGTVTGCGSAGQKMADDRSHLPATSCPLRSSGAPFGSMSVTLSCLATSKICSRSAGWMSPTERCRDGFEIRVPLFARELRDPAGNGAVGSRRLVPGRKFWLWRAVDEEGEVLDLHVHTARQSPRSDCRRTMSRLAQERNRAENSHQPTRRKMQPLQIARIQPSVSCPFTPLLEARAFS